MKLHPPTTILGIVAVFLIGLAGFGKQNSKAEDVRCEVAAAYIKSVFDDGGAFKGTKPIVLQTTSPPRRKLREYLASEHARPSDKVNPLLPLYFKLEQTEEVNVANICPDILHRFERFVTEPNRNPVREADGYWDRVYFGLSVPAVTKDENLALIEASFVYGDLGGGGVEVLMLKDSRGVWRVAQESGTWIS